MALTVIISPEVLGIMLVIVLAGAGIMTKIVRGKYGYTPEKEKELNNYDGED